jgi:hypothetical protein
VWGAVASPELQRALEVPLRSVTAIDGQIGHREPVRNARQPLHDARDALALELVAEPLDNLRRSRVVDLGKREVQLAADTGKVLMRRAGLVGDQRARVDARRGDELVVSRRPSDA